ncbi:Isa2p NDAI_0A05150 [Naumovozyma dairenensis CBS 421]|uniref:Core domain-containing protein n=1 Tax=Naumovozyma dairenensis (strain ATCC 10597 / BCRC 20456 / CBS 421 / NBRC 0211 / NRRL Y-12639) TaxID=1071378 RepID=G0W4D2_NAUDC|nr:hypothetical protein NDAI_0A05150 [Naumovozyma dairenensis CBS 421]CCD22670.1 hypothetical protein NDAI_0A05150 [Naumovozyma dairenensis CBS 421]
MFFRSFIKIQRSVRLRYTILSSTKSSVHFKNIELYRRFLTTSNDSMVKPLEIINGRDNLNMSITERACERLNEIYKDSKEILKINVESGGCHGFQYNLKLIPDSVGSSKNNTDSKNFMEQSTDDAEFKYVPDDSSNIIYVLPKDRAKVMIDEKSLKILNNTTLTYTTELIGSTFKITNGNMKSTCGCGSSFDIDIDLDK